LSEGKGTISRREGKNSRLLAAVHEKKKKSIFNDSSAEEKKGATVHWRGKEKNSPQ